MALKPFFKQLLNHVFIFGCAGSSLLHSISLVAVLLIAAASLVAESGLYGTRASLAAVPRL